MHSPDENYKELQDKVSDLQHRLFEAEDTLDAIRKGAVDALVIDGNEGLQVYTLQTADHTYRLLIEEMTEGALILSKDSTVIYSNKSFADLINLPLEKIIGKSFYKLVKEDDIGAFRKMVDMTNRELNQFRCTLVSGKEKIPVKITLKQFEKEELPVLNMTVTDMRAQVRSEKQIKAYQRELEKTIIELKRSNNELEQFAYVASHDLMEPLRMVSNFTQLLLKKLNAEDPDSIEYQEFILTGISRMEMMIKDLLQYSRVGRKDVIFEPVNMNEIVSKAIKNLDDKVKKSKAIIEYSNLPSIYGVPGLILQVFQNLIENAIKFAKEGSAPQIIIEAQRTDGHYEFCVEDNGIGIDEQFADRIFIIFQRLHTKDRYPGSGIGLAITKKIIDFHGGKIWLKSKVGEGCIFHFTLPAAE